MTLVHTVGIQSVQMLTGSQLCYKKQGGLKMGGCPN